MRLLSFVTPHREDYPHSQCSGTARGGSARKLEVSHDV
jgi:hypothetical protein